MLNIYKVRSCDQSSATEASALSKPALLLCKHGGCQNQELDLRAVIENLVSHSVFHKIVSDAVQGSNSNNNGNTNNISSSPGSSTNTSSSSSAILRTILL